MCILNSKDFSTLLGEHQMHYCIATVPLPITCLLIQIKTNTSACDIGNATSLHCFI